MPDSRHKELRRGTELASSFYGPQGEPIIEALQAQITDWVKELLDPTLPDPDALFLRAKIIGVIQVLDRMGDEMQLAQSAAVAHAARQKTEDSLRTTGRRF